MIKRFILEMRIICTAHWRIYQAILCFATDRTHGEHLDFLMTGAVMFRRFGLFFGIVFLLAGCNSKAVVEGVPAEEVEVSQVPEISEDAGDKALVLYGEDGVRKASDEERVYGAVVPVGWVRLSVTERETRFYVKGMSAHQIELFLEKYYPYQDADYTQRNDLFYVHPEIKAAYRGDAIVPSLDVNVIKPQTPLLIKIFYNEKKDYYEWIYRDPEYAKPQDDAGPAAQSGVAAAEDPMMIEAEGKKVCEACDRREDWMTDEDLASVCRLCDAYRQKSPQN